MGRQLLPAYLAIVHLCAIAFLSLLLIILPPATIPWFDLGFWVLFGFAAHAIQFNAAAFRDQSIRVSVGFGASAAVIGLFPPPLAAIVICLSSISWRDLTGKNEWYKVAFNRSMFLLCGGLAALVYATVKGLNPQGEVTWIIGSNLVAALVYFTANSLLVALAVALAAQRPVREVWVFASNAITLASYLTLAAFGATLALIYTRLSPLAVLFFSVPLIASYYGLRNSARIQQFYTQIVRSLADSLDLREHETAGHSQRIALYSQRLGEALGLRGRALESLYLAGLLHDIGKLGMPDQVLLKPSALTPQEWEQTRRHPVDGARLLEPYEYLSDVAAIVLHHHERYDGSGYPEGLRGEAIPLGARIIAVVDAFDALHSGRPYRAAVPLEATRQEIHRSGGTHFDPQVVDAFLSIDWQRETERMQAQAVEHAHQ